MRKNRTKRRTKRRRRMRGGGFFDTITGLFRKKKEAPTLAREGTERTAELKNPTPMPVEEEEEFKVENVSPDGGMGAAPVGGKRRRRKSRKNKRGGCGCAAKSLVGGRRKKRRRTRKKKKKHRTRKRRKHDSWYGPGGDRDESWLAGIFF